MILCDLVPGQRQPKADRTSMTSGFRTEYQHFQPSGLRDDGRAKPGRSDGEQALFYTSYTFYALASWRRCETGQFLEEARLKAEVAELPDVVVAAARTRQACITAKVERFMLLALLV